MPPFHGRDERRIGRVWRECSASSVLVEVYGAKGERRFRRIERDRSGRPSSRRKDTMRLAVFVNVLDHLVFTVFVLYFSGERELDRDPHGILPIRRHDDAFDAEVHELFEVFVARLLEKFLGLLPYLGHHFLPRAFGGLFMIEAPEECVLPRHFLFVFRLLRFERRAVFVEAFLRDDPLDVELFVALLFGFGFHQESMELGIPITCGFRVVFGVREDFAHRPLEEEVRIEEEFAQGLCYHSLDLESGDMVLAPPIFAYTDDVVVVATVIAEILLVVMVADEVLHAGFAVAEELSLKHVRPHRALLRKTAVGFEFFEDGFGFLRRDDGGDLYLNPLVFRPFAEHDALVSDLLVLLLERLVHAREDGRFREDAVDGRLRPMRDGVLPHFPITELSGTLFFAHGRREDAFLGEHLGNASERRVLVEICSHDAEDDVLLGFVEFEFLRRGILDVSKGDGRERPLVVLRMLAFSRRCPEFDLFAFPCGESYDGRAHESVHRGISRELLFRVEDPDARIREVLHDLLEDVLVASDPIPLGEDHEV